MLLMSIWLFRNRDEKINFLLHVATRWLEDKKISRLRFESAFRVVAVNLRAAAGSLCNIVKNLTIRDEIPFLRRRST